jgi:hypothetical protein
MLLLPAAARACACCSDEGDYRVGTGRPSEYELSLVLQGRGNGCHNAEDFKHWRLQIGGRRAEYAFYGELGEPR